jgi:hypothetical protein
VKAERRGVVTYLAATATGGFRTTRQMMRCGSRGANIVFQYERRTAAATTCCAEVVDQRDDAGPAFRKECGPLFFAQTEFF